MQLINKAICKCYYTLVVQLVVQC